MRKCIPMKPKKRSKNTLLRYVFCSLFFSSLLFTMRLSGKRSSYFPFHLHCRVQHASTLNLPSYRQNKIFSMRKKTHIKVDIYISITSSSLHCLVHFLSILIHFIRSPLDRAQHKHITNFFFSHFHSVYFRYSSKLFHFSFSKLKTFRHHKTTIRSVCAFDVISWFSRWSRYRK